MTAQRWSCASLVIETANSTYVLDIYKSSNELRCIKGTYEDKDWAVDGLGQYLDGWNHMVRDEKEAADAEAAKLVGKSHAFVLHKDDGNDSGPTVLTTTTVKRAYWTLYPPDMVSA